MDIQYHGIIFEFIAFVAYTIIKDKGANHPFAASGWITKDADQRGQVERHTTNHTQPTIYTAYLKHILWLKVCERTVLTVGRNCIDCW